MLTKDGWRQRTHFTMPPELFEQYRLGRRCPACHSLQEREMPEECEVHWKDGGKCGFKIRRDLPRWLAMEFEGEEALWPEQEHDTELEDWVARNPGLWLPGDE